MHAATQAKSIDIVKRSGRRPTEQFDHEKLRTSIHAACLSVRSPDGEAQRTASEVTHAVIIWLETKPEVTSNDLRRIAGHHLKKFHPEAAYIYEQHKHII